MTPKDTATSKHTTSKTIVDPAKPTADVKHTSNSVPVEPPKAEAPITPATTDAGKSVGKTILSLSIPESTARKIRLLAKLVNLTISQLVLASVAKEIPARLKVALASIKDEVE